VIGEELLCAGEGFGDVGLGEVRGFIVEFGIEFLVFECVEFVVAEIVFVGEVVAEGAESGEGLR
jgi:hypothetical protein